MDFKEKIAELRAQKNDLLAKAEELVSAGKYEEADAVTGQMTGINNSIRSLESLAEASRQSAAPVDGGKSADVRPKNGQESEKLFTSLGEQLGAIYNFRKNHVEDRRLQKVNNAVLGANEGTGSDGGLPFRPTLPA